MRSAKLAELLKNVPQELKKSVEEGVDVLERYHMSNVRARVCAIVDISGSMKALAENGMLQNLFNKFFSLGVLFDDNQEIEVFLLGGPSPYGIYTVNKENFSTFIKQIDQEHGFKSATNYDVPVRQALEHYFPVKQKGNRKNDDPVFCAFLTDGEPTDGSGSKAKNLIRDAASQGMPIFFKFLALNQGRCDFALLQSIDDDESRLFDNTDFVEVKKPTDLTMQELINEFRGFVLEMKEKQLISKDYGIPMHFLYDEGRVKNRVIGSKAMFNSASYPVNNQVGARAINYVVPQSFHQQGLFSQTTAGNRGLVVSQKSGDACKCLIQ
jgi:hypothetical protein